MLADLSRLVGSDYVLDPADGASAYLQDATQSAGIRGRAAAVVRPGDAEQVAEVVRWCYARGVPIVPRGGGTGYAGGAVPLDDAAVVLALERLDRVRSFEPLLWRMEAEAGVLTATVARLARENGLLYPPDPGSAESSHIGGNVATNAGGPHSFKHGVTRAWVTGVEAVLAPGELVRVGGSARKDVAGYDLVSLLCGAEGTLGVVTAIALRLTPAPEASLPVAAFYASAQEGQAAIESVFGSGVVPAALEFLDAGAIAAAASSFPGGAPAGAGLLLVAEADGSEAEARHVRDELVEAMGYGALEVRSWDTASEARELWRWREGVSLAVTAQRGGKLSEDIAVPVDRLADAIAETVAIAERHGLEGCSWGHAGDGNVHSTFMLDPGDAAQRERADEAAQDLFALAIRLGGTVTGEHGLGWLKRGQLEQQWPPAAVEAHRAIKRALDPKGLFNPGKKAV